MTGASPPQQPRTEAGRELLADLAYTRDNYLDSILAIEEEARAVAPPLPERTDREGTVEHGVCVEHYSPMERWPDKSGQCLHCCTVETSCDCTLMDAVEPPLPHPYKTGDFAIEGLTDEEADAFIEAVSGEPPLPRPAIGKIGEPEPGE